MGLTMTQLIGHQVACDNLTELGPLTIKYTSGRTRLWHAECAGVEVLRANGERHGIDGTSSSADEAVMNLWNALLGLPPGDAILVRGSRDDKRLVRWDDTCSEWVDVKK